MVDFESDSQAMRLKSWDSRSRALLAIASFIATYPTSRIMSRSRLFRLHADH
jgi:hypothetical protein